MLQVIYKLQVKWKIQLTSLTSLSWPVTMFGFCKKCGDIKDDIWLYTLTLHIQHEQIPYKIEAKLYSTLHST